MSKILDRTGEESYNKFGSKIIITGYRNNTDVDIYFPEYDWTFYHAQYNKFKNGNIKCPYEPRVVNNGFIGEGEYKTVENGSNTRSYHTWKSMLTRCYDDNYHIKKPSYINCYVCDEWLNYQNFAEWYENNYYEIDEETMNLDKDILVKGNIVYGPETCIFVPQKINDLFCLNNDCRGELPVGVYKHNCGKFVSECCDGNGNQKYLGLYNTIEEAFLVYKQYKEKIIQDIANEYFNLIPTTLYLALMNYQVEIDD